MTQPLYLTRMTLAQDAAVAALAPVLLPGDPDARAGAAHRLMWTLFAEDPEAERDFLWREEAAGVRPGRSRFYVLSRREPVNGNGLFEMDEPKPFAPVLRAGDRLAFALRANPVVSRRRGEGDARRQERHDVVMDRLAALPKGERAAVRFAAVQEAGRDWLMKQGERRGFVFSGPDALKVNGYDQMRIGRGRGMRPIEISTLDFQGVLEVTDPNAFTEALRAGFGKAKAFGCGLMLVRRA